MAHLPVEGGTVEQTNLAKSQQARGRLVEEQLRRRGIRDERVLDAFLTLPRDVFVPPAMRPEAYADRALPIPCDQTISQPYVVARMTELLALRGVERVLEIGTGSGYQTAILARLARQVYSIERHASLSETAHERLNALGYPNITLRVADGTWGWPDAAPFDAILVTAASPIIPPPLLAQLGIGGRLVVPVGKRDQQLLTRIERDDTGILHRTTHGQVRFVPLKGEYGW